MSKKERVSEKPEKSKSKIYHDEVEAPDWSIAYKEDQTRCCFPFGCTWNSKLPACP